MSTPSDSPTTDIDVWTTPLGRWRLEWVAYLRGPVDAPSVVLDASVDGSSWVPTEAFSVVDPPRPDEPCPDEVDGNAATAGVTLDPVPTIETLQ